ncbi:putative P-loop containing nucleoside triphosphate hydrolase [Rosa chinensis]|uniref:Sulfotransferase n=1 Tax=Rosa chinensis TaxID=74649 RepID=A0A2P6QV68_ROSCH|nr:putative P-loop containing nucleoside triphosphate hydrolase [Rosa chinensis]
MILEGIILAQQSFRGRDKDIILAAFPKCGTTWTKAPMLAIQNQNRYGQDHSSQSFHPLLTKNPHNVVPFLELHVDKDNPIAYLDPLLSPRLLSTYSSYLPLPNSVLNYPNAWIVCNARNPKVVLVSLWAFHLKTRPPNSNNKLWQRT